jgi:uncharacterized membrane protein
VIEERADIRRRALVGVPWALLCGAIALGVLLRVRLIDEGSLWLDELWTLDAVSRSFQEMVGARLVSDQAPPLWTSLTWLWLHVVGTYDSAAMRASAVLWSCVAVAAPAIGAWRLRALGSTLLVTAALLALSTIAVQFAVELRNYSFAMAMASVAVVVWAGLLTDSLAPTGRSIFVLALVGALGGFAHYYGNFVHAALLAVLAAVWARRQARRPLLLLLGWGAASFVPVVSWYFATRRWSPNIAVAAEPGLGALRTWLQYAFSPLATAVARQPPGYADGRPGTGAWIAAAIVLVLVAATTVPVLRGRRHGTASRPTAVALLGCAALLVLVLVVAMAWIASLVLPPSMNARNLAPAVPALFLAAACATTSARRDTTRWVSAGLVLILWFGACVFYVGEHGVRGLTPTWQAEAGYRDGARAVLAARRDRPGMTLIGLEQPWAWHGDWDAVLRAETGSAPAQPDDPPPLAARWVVDAADPMLEDVERGPLVVFGSAEDGRFDALLAWAAEVAGGCQVESFGGPGLGLVKVARCPSPAAG